MGGIVSRLEDDLQQHVRTHHHYCDDPTTASQSVAQLQEMVYEYMCLLTEGMKPATLDDPEQAPVVHNGCVSFSHPNVTIFRDRMQDSERIHPNATRYGLPGMLTGSKSHLLADPFTPILSFRHFVRGTSVRILERAGAMPPPRATKLNMAAIRCSVEDCSARGSHYTPTAMLSS